MTRTPALLRKTPSTAKTFSVGLLLVLASACASAQAPADERTGPDWTRPISTAQETVVDLGHGLYALTSDAWPLAGNTTIAVGTDGIIVVDTQFAGLYARMRSKIEGISKLPVKFVVNTHFHRDHVEGNAAFGASGALIASHAMAAERMAHPPMRANGSPGLNMPPVGLPVITYEGARMTLRVGSQTAQLVHPARPAHTDGDTFVYFPEANVLSAGDLFDSIFYPGIELQFGGSIDGVIAATKEMLSFANETTRIVPGHGHIATKRDLEEFLAMLVSARERVAKAKADGMTEKQVMDANLLADFNPRWLLDPSRAWRFPSLIYQSIK
jgi:glyoxylase-like metal-dependent hydrolase (beta-lactamase superfamily II)